MSWRTCPSWVIALLGLWVGGCGQTPSAAPPRLEEVPADPSAEREVVGEPMFLDLGPSPGGWQYPHTSLLLTGPSSTDRSFQAGLQAYHNKRYAEAVAALSAFINANPTHAGGFSVLAAAHFRLKNLKEAQVAAQSAVSLEPTPNAWNNLASIQMASGDRQGAIQSLEAGLLLDGKNYLAWRNLGTLHYARGELAGAQWALGNLVRCDPRDTYGYIALAQVYVEMDQPQKAIELYRARLAMLEHEGEEARRRGLTIELPLALGKVLFAQGQLEEAEQRLRQALEVTHQVPSSWVPLPLYRAHIHVNLGRVVEARGRPADALVEYERALAQTREPGFDQALAKVIDVGDTERRVDALRALTGAKRGGP